MRATGRPRRGARMGWRLWLRRISRLLRGLIGRLGLICRLRLIHLLSLIGRLRWPRGLHLLFHWLR